MNGIDWTPLFNAVIALIGLVLTVYIIPLIKAKASTAQLDALRVGVQTAVYAAEQLFAAGGLGEAKKQWVVEYLRNQGINVDEEKISALIESIVFELNREVDKTDKGNNLEPVTEVEVGEEQTTFETGDAE